MINIKVGSGDETGAVKKMKVITANNRAEAVKDEQVEKLGQIIVGGESFVFTVDERGIAMFHIDSSMIGHLGWFNDEMFVTFPGKSGFTMYGYTGITDTRFADLINAQSIGRRFGLMRSESLKDYVRFF